jgi:hypothetical protein
VTLPYNRVVLGMADGGIEDVGEYFLLLHSPFHSKELNVSLEHAGDGRVPQDAYSVSSESLLNCSQVCNSYFLLARRDETLTTFPPLTANKLLAIWRCGYHRGDPRVYASDTNCRRTRPARFFDVRNELGQEKG